MRFTLVAVIWVLLTSIFVVFIKHFLDIFGLRETFCFVCITLLMGFKLFLSYSSVVELLIILFCGLCNVLPDLVVKVCFFTVKN